MTTDRTPSNAAARKRRHRARERRGVVVLPVEVDEAAFVDALVADGLLGPDEVPDRHQLAGQASLALIDWISERRRHA